MRVGRGRTPPHAAQRQSLPMLATEPGRRAEGGGRPVPWAEKAQDVLDRLGATRHGLSRSEAARRLVVHGRNVLPEPPLTGAVTVFVRQFASPFIYVLLVALALSVALREWSDAIFIGVVVVLNAVIGAVQEFRAERSAQALRHMVGTTCRAVRDGDAAEIDATELVPGDVVLLASGDKVPADLRLLGSLDLHADESLLTGESLPVGKHADRLLDADVGLADRVNMAFAGTLVTRGRADAVVVSTGIATELGALAAELTALEDPEAPLLTRMRRFTHWVAGVMVVVAGLFGVIELARGIPLHEVALVAIALSVSAIPEGLPVALTIALAVAMRRMAQRNVIVRRMAAVEALGSCTVIATDKTGTLTVNELTATAVLLPGGSHWRVSGAGTSPEGEAEPEELADEGSRGRVIGLARSAALCNEAVFVRENGGWANHGDALDVSLLVLAHKVGITQPEALAGAPLLDRVPFESERRFAASLHAGEAGSAEVHVKGAVESVIEMCDRQRGPAGDEPIDRNEAVAAAVQLAEEGCRVVAVASGTFEHPPVDGAGAPSPRGAPGAQRLLAPALEGLTWLGLVGMIDPPRTDAPAAVAACRAAGLRVIMVTGDHPATALAVARQVGIATASDDVITGSQLRAACDDAESPDAAVDALVAGASVVARVEPVQKLDVVESLYRRGDFVAVTGDGANDAPALRRAHVGVAMGASGTDVAKEAADLVVTDDHFSSIAAGVEEGRVAYANVRKVVSLLISTGAGELMLFLLVLATGMPLPLTAVQLLWLNLVTNGIQDVALAFEPAEGNEMLRSPRTPEEPVFNRLMIERIAVAAAIIGVASFVVFRLALDAGWSLDAARNAVVALLVLFENVLVLNVRSETGSFFPRGLRGNRLLVVGVLSALAVQVAAMHLGPTRDLLAITSLPAATWGLLVAVAVVLWAAVEAQKLALRRRDPLGRTGGVPRDG